MKIDNIEMCKALIDKREKLQRASDLLSDEQAIVIVTQGLSKAAERTDIYDECLNLAVQDAIAERIKQIEKQIELL